MELYHLDTGEIFKVVDEYGSFKVIENYLGEQLVLSPDFLQYWEVL